MKFKRILFNGLGSFHYRPNTIITQSIRYKNIISLPYISFLSQHSGCITEYKQNYLKRNYPKLLSIGESDIKMTLNVLKKFHIDTQHALKYPHLFEMNPMLIEFYGTILRECGFSEVEPMHLMRYLKLSRSMTIEQLKHTGLIPKNLDLKQKLMECFEHWPNNFKIREEVNDSTTTLRTIRLIVLQKYLEWRLSMTEIEFNKFLKANAVTVNRPMASIQESLHIAESIIQLDAEAIKKYSFVICADPNNVKLILSRLDKIAGIEPASLMKMTPHLFRCNYKSVLGVKQILQKYGILEEAQVRHLRVYCVKPETLEQRIKLFQKNPHYATSDSSTLLSAILNMKNNIEPVDSIDLSVLKRKRKNRKEIPVFICENLPEIELSTDKSLKTTEMQDHVSFVQDQLKRHQNYNNFDTKNIVETIALLRDLLKFSDRAIYDNCQLLLYPSSKIKMHIEYIEAIYSSGTSELQTPSKIRLYQELHGIDYAQLSENQILSLVLYVMEKEFYFSGDGIWDSIQDGQD